MKTEIELKELIGLRMLSGVDEEYDKLPSRYTDGDAYDGNIISFVLDGETYTAFEDDNDGYRSCMDKILKTDAHVKNSFEPIQVFGVYVDKDGYNTADMVRFYDVKTGLIVLEVGTDNSDDYYPSFVSSFNPANMYINQI